MSYREREKKVHTLEQNEHTFNETHNQSNCIWRNASPLQIHTAYNLIPEKLNSLK